MSKLEQLPEQQNTAENISNNVPAKGIGKILNWVKRHPVTATVLVLGSSSGGLYAEQQYEQAQDIQAVRDEMSALKEDNTEISKNDVNQLTEMIREKTQELDAIIAKLEELREEGVRFRSDVVENVLRSIQSGKSALDKDNGKVNDMTFVNGLVDKLGSITSVKVANKGKNLLRRYGNVNLEAAPKLKSELDVLSERLSKLRVVMLEMEDLDLETPTNNFFVNFNWEVEKPLSEEFLVKQIKEDKELREKRLEKLAVALDTYGMFAKPDPETLDEVQSDLKESMNSLSQLNEAYESFLDKGDGDPLAAMQELEKQHIDFYLRYLEQEDGEPKEKPDAESIRITQQMLIDLNILPKGHVNGRMDFATKQAEAKLREKIAIVMAEASLYKFFEGEIFSAKAKEAQEMLVYFGFLKKEDIDVDGHFRDKSYVRAGQFLEKINK